MLGDGQKTPDRNIPCAITISNAIVGSNQFYLKNEFSEPFHRLPKSGEDLFTFLNTEFLDPIKGIEPWN